jgi:hypothetical protein
MTVDPVVIARDRWELWLRVLDHGLLPSVADLAGQVLERGAAGRRLWHDALAPALRAEFGPVFAAAAAAAGGELRRVASAGHALGVALHRLHADDAADADEAGQVVMWLTLAAAAMDHLVDDGHVDPHSMRRYVSPAAVIAALRGDAPIEVPGHDWLARLLARGLGGLGARMGRRADAYHRELGAEIEVCLQEMVAAQLYSDELTIAPWSDVPVVRRRLRAINALTAWLAAYVGLLGRDRPPPATLAAVRRAATLVGDIGWALDALSDIHADLAHRLWNLVWVELAEVTGPDAAWLVDPDGAPAVALDALRRSGVIGRILDRTGQQIRELERDLELGDRGRELAQLCQYMVWAFLNAEAPA